MNNIQVTISAPELVEAMQALTAALQQGSVKPAQLETTIEKLQEEAKPKKQKEEPKTEEIELAAPAKAPTLEDVRALLGTLSQQGKQAEVKKLIASFGATKLTEIDKASYADVLTQAEAL